MVSMRKARIAASKLGADGRNKVFCGLSGKKYEGGAWAKQNKACYKDWMDYCGVRSVEEIDYNQPNVFIEYRLNNPTYRKMVTLGSPTEREVFWGLLETDDQRKMYFIGDGTGAYCDMEPDKGVLARQWYAEHYPKQISN